MNLLFFSLGYYFINLLFLFSFVLQNLGLDNFYFSETVN